jgi:four helix bundle protein
MKDLSELRIYRLAVEIAELVWQEVMTWDSFAKWTLGKQLVDAADGIAATMMEGYYRFSPAEQRKFFQYAFSSAKETALDWWRAKQRNLISSEGRYKEVQKKLDDLLPQTMNYIHAVKSKTITK